MVLLTDVAGVKADFGTPDQRLIAQATPDQLAAMTFAPGTMAPKVAAAITMARAGRLAMIGALAELPAILRREVGTRGMACPAGAEAEAEAGASTPGPGC